MVYSIGFTTLPKLTIQISSNIILVVIYCIKHIRAASLWNHPLHQLNPYITQSLNPNEYHVAKQHVQPPYFMVKPCYTVIPWLNHQCSKQRPWIRSKTSSPGRALPGPRAVPIGAPPPKPQTHWRKGLRMWVDQWRRTLFFSHEPKAKG